LLLHGSYYIASKDLLTERSILKISGKILKNSCDKYNSIMAYKAFLFDMNGTMINDMAYQVKVWHKIINNLGVAYTPEQVKAECYGKNHDFLERIFPGRFSLEEKNKLSLQKENEYKINYKPHLKLINGLDFFLENASASKIKMAIGSAAIKDIIDFVIDGLNIRHYFDAIVSADDVAFSKPNPETFLKCAAALGIPLQDCVVFEDAPKGVEAAANAGMKCIVLTTMHTAAEFAQYKNIIGFAADFTSPVFLNLLK
jgi:beta-phosphoglucomutase